MLANYTMTNTNGRIVKKWLLISRHPGWMALLAVSLVFPCFGQMPMSSAPQTAIRPDQTMPSRGLSPSPSEFCESGSFGDPTTGCIPPWLRYQPGYGAMSPFDFDNGSGYPTRGDFGYPVENGLPAPMAERQPSTPISQHFEKEPLTDFQRYVSASVGQVLPIYGASLF